VIEFLLWSFTCSEWKMKYLMWFVDVLFDLEVGSKTDC
jgi:hypothetical protein